MINLRFRQWIVIFIFLLTGLPAIAQPVFFADKGLSDAENAIRDEGIDCDCIIALGTEALTGAIGYAKAINKPIMTAYVSAARIEESIKQNPWAKIIALYGEPDPVKQIRLAELITGHHQIAVFYSDRSEYLKKHIPEQQLIKTESSTIRTTLNRLNYIDGVIAIPDSKIWNQQSFKIAALSLYRQNKVLVGFSKRLVEIGAVASLYYEDSDYLAEFIDLISKYDTSNVTTVSRYPTTYRLALNGKVADSLHLIVPDSALLLNEIGKVGTRYE